VSHPNSQLATELPDLLDRAIERVSEGVALETHRERLVQMRERLREERFHLAVLGQFKRGKSTLLNALLGEAILPAAVLPVTSILTFLRTGEERRVRIELEDRAELTDEGSDAVSSLLSKFATEEGNPENRLGVTGIEVFHPAPILRGGVVLIDTPGIGSTHRHNTLSTLEFLPQCDAALFLTSVDPPMTQVELEFLREVRSKVVRLFYVLNKIDYLPEEDRPNVLSFFERALRQELAAAEDVAVFGVSARRGLEAKLSKDPELWKRSGMEEVQNHLVDFLAKEKKRTLERAVAKKTGWILRDVLLEASLAVRSLEMRGEEVEERLDLLEGKIEEARRQQILAADLLAGDERRLQGFLGEMAARWLKVAGDHFRGILRAALERGSEGEAPDHRAVEEVLAGAIPPFFERELGEAARAFGRRVLEAIGPHHARLHELVESVRCAAAELFDVPYQPSTGDPGFELSVQPYWITHEWSTSLSPVREGFLDRLLPEGARRRRLEARFHGKIDALVAQNVETLRWTLLQELRRSFLRFRRTLEDGLTDAIAVTRDAIEAASVRRQQQSEAVSQEIAARRAHLRGIEEVERALGRV